MAIHNDQGKSYKPQDPNPLKQVVGPQGFSRFLTNRPSKAIKQWRVGVPTFFQLSVSPKSIISLIYGNVQVFFHLTIRPLLNPLLSIMIPYFTSAAFRSPGPVPGPFWEFPWREVDDLTWGTTQQRYWVLRVRLPPYLLHTVGRGMRWKAWNRENLLGGGQIFWWIRKMWSHGVYIYTYIVLFFTYIYIYLYISYVSSRYYNSKTLNCLGRLGGIPLQSLAFEGFPTAKNWSLYPECMCM